MKNYSYRILNLVTSDNMPDKPNYVKRILVNLEVSDQDNQTATMDCFFNLPEGQDSTFIDFNQLDEVTIRNWIDSCQEQWAIHKRDLDSILSAKYPKDQLKLKAVPWQVAEISQITASQVPTEDVYMDPSVMQQNQIEMQKKYLETLVRQIMSEIKN